MRANPDTRNTELQPGIYEVVLSVNATVTTGENETCFIAEVQQAGIFALANVPEARLQQVLGTICPATLFPYVREAVDSLAVKGGFPAAHLAPVNFDALFAEAVRQQQAGAQPGDAPQH